MHDRLVLIVEDEPTLQTLYSTILNEAGIDTIIASTGEEGATLALERHPDVILMDVILPDISGHDAVAKIRHDDWGKNAVIIYLTNHADPEHVYHAVQHGSEDYLVKANVTNQELLNKVRSALMS